LAKGRGDKTTRRQERQAGRTSRFGQPAWWFVAALGILLLEVLIILASSYAFFKLADQTGTLRHDDLVTKRNTLEKRRSRMVMSSGVDAALSARLRSQTGRMARPR